MPSWRPRKKVIAEEAAEVCAAGGLFIIGTERHESRRIDNQLRGRAGRRGDPGASRFFISWRTTSCACSAASASAPSWIPLGVEEDMPIENKMISGTIENAQKKLEARNFSIRKKRAAVRRRDEQPARDHLRPARQRVLRGEDVSENVHTMIHESIAANAQLFRRAKLPTTGISTACAATTAAGWPRTAIPSLHARSSWAS